MLTRIDPQLAEYHINAAYERWKAETGGSWPAFFIGGAEFMVDWLYLFEPKLVAEFLAAVAATHGQHSEESFDDAKTRLEKSRSDLLAWFASNARNRRAA